MTSLMDLAPQHATKTRKFAIVNPDDVEFVVEVSYYPNKLTMEPVAMPDGVDEEDDDTGRTSLKNAQSFCDMLSGWDITGPVYNRDGDEVSPADEPIRLDAHVIRCVPTWITSQITTKIMELEFPNRSGARAGRKRS
jgi:hypothetical protein